MNGRAGGFLACKPRVYLPVPFDDKARATINTIQPASASTTSVPGLGHAHAQAL